MKATAAGLLFLLRSHPTLRNDAFDCTLLRLAAFHPGRDIDHVARVTTKNISGLFCSHAVDMSQRTAILQHRPPFSAALLRWLVRWNCRSLEGLTQSGSGSVRARSPEEWIIRESLMDAR